MNYLTGYTASERKTLSRAAYFERKRKAARRKKRAKKRKAQVKKYNQYGFFYY